MNHALLIAVKAYVSACNIIPPEHFGASAYFSGTITINTQTDGERELEKAQNKVDCEKATKKMLTLLNAEKCSEE